MIGEDCYRHSKFYHSTEDEYDILTYSLASCATFHTIAGQIFLPIPIPIPIVQQSDPYSIFTMSSSHLPGAALPTNTVFLYKSQLSPIELTMLLYQYEHGSMTAVHCGFACVYSSGREHADVEQCDVPCIVLQRERG